MTFSRAQRQQSERGTSLLELLVAVVILGVVIPVAGMQLVHSASFRQIKLNKSTAVSLADGAVIQSALGLRESVQKALAAEVVDVRAQVFLDVITRALQAEGGPSGARLITKTSTVPVPSASTLNRGAYRQTSRRCKGQIALRPASPWLGDSVAYLCFRLDSAVDMAPGLLNSVDKAYPVLIELAMQPVDYATGSPVPFDQLTERAATSHIRLFYSVVWVDKKGAHKSAFVQSTAKEQYVPIL